MKALKRFFGRLTGSVIRNYCICGHTVSSNLAFCPHCGRRLDTHEDSPLD